MSESGAPHAGLTAALCLCAVACSTSPDGANDPREEAPDAVPAPVGAPTFVAVYRDVLATHDCTLGLCHGEGARGGGLTLQPPATGYENLVGVPSRSRECGPTGLVQVEPGEPEGSLFFLKLIDPPPCGSLMPPDEALGEAALAQVRQWIVDGAPFE